MMSPLTLLKSVISRFTIRQPKGTSKSRSAKRTKSKISQPSGNDSNHHPKQLKDVPSSNIASQSLQSAIVDDEQCRITGVGSKKSSESTAGLTATDLEFIITEPEASQLASPTCHLLNIPFEVRRRILEFALPYATEDAQFAYVWSLGSTSVLQTCQQLHREGTHVMYDANPLNCIIDIDNSQILFCARYLQPSTNPFPKYEDGMDCFFNHCRDTMNWTRIYERTVSPETLGGRNVAVMRHWILEIMGCNDIIGCLRHYTCDVAELTEKIRELVEKAVVGLLLRADKISKVTVQWKGTEPDTYTNREENQQRILEPVRLLGVLVEEDMSFLEAWK